jgi:hypothetical protein
LSLVAGFDYSTHAVDLVLLDEDSNNAEWHRYDLIGHDAFERTRSVPQWLPSRGFYRDSGVLAIFIEEPRGKGKIDSSTLFRIQGAILATLPPEIVVGPLMPHQWKPKCGLKGNAQKYEVDCFAHETWVNRPISAVQDAHDAFAIAYAGRQLYTKQVAA